MHARDSRQNEPARLRKVKCLRDLSALRSSNNQLMNNVAIHRIDGPLVDDVSPAKFSLFVDGFKINALRIILIIADALQEQP